MKQDLNSRQMHTIESLPQISKLKSRTSTIATFAGNSDIEVLDLSASGENPYPQNRGAGKSAGLMVRSKRMATNLKKPIYSYSSKELPDLSLVGFDSHNPIPSSPFKAPQHDPDHTSPTLDTPTDYDEAGIDLFMTGLAGEILVMQDTSAVPGHSLRAEVCKSNLVFSSNPSDLAPRLSAHMDEKPSNPDSQPPLANRSFVGDWQSPKLQALEIDSDENGGVSVDGEVVEELSEYVNMSPGLSPQINQSVKKLNVLFGTGLQYFATHNTR